MARGIAIIKFLVKFDCFENEVVRLSVKQLWLLCNRAFILHYRNSLASVLTIKCLYFILSVHC